MKHGKYLVLIIAGCLGLTKVSAQQSIQFTQYMFNSMSVNPSYAGYKEEWFAQVGLRSQWTGWDGAPKTGTISVDGVLDPYTKRHGVGINLTADKLGAQSATSFYANYALRLQLDDEDTKRLSLGVAGGFTQYGLDGNKIITTEGSDPVLPEGKISDFVPDIRLGAYFYTPKWYVGVSVQDLFSGSNSGSDYRFNQNITESIYRTVHGYFIAGALFEVQEGFHIRPSLLLKEDFKGPTSLDLNAMLVFNRKFWIGAGYRTRAKVFKRTYEEQSANKLSAMNAITGIAQFYVTDRLRIGYSYDAMINKMSGNQGGTHEVTIGVTFGRVGTKQYLNPRFF